MWGNDEPGRLFTTSNIGNRVVQGADQGDAVSGDVLYPVMRTGTEIIIVVGHTGCGAITATYDGITGGSGEPEGIAQCLNLLGPYLEPGVEILPADLSRPATVNRLVEYNVDRQIKRLRAIDAVPKSATIVGVVYDFQNIHAGRRGKCMWSTSMARWRSIPS